LYAQNEAVKNIDWKLGEVRTYQMIQTKIRGEENKQEEFKLELKVLAVNQEDYQLQATFSMVYSLEILAKSDDFGKKLMALTKDYVVFYKINKQGTIISDFDAEKTFQQIQEGLAAMAAKTTDEGQGFAVAILRDGITKKNMLPSFVEVLKQYHSVYGLNYSKKQGKTKQDSILVYYKAAKTITLPATTTIDITPENNQFTNITHKTVLVDFAITKQLLEKEWGDMIKYFPPPTIKKAEILTTSSIDLQTMFIHSLNSQKEEHVDKKQTILKTVLKIQ